MDAVFHFLIWLGLIGIGLGVLVTVLQFGVGILLMVVGIIAAGGYALWQAFAKWAKLK
jgi:hypothetical protein